jgi:hypothetical protein
VSSKDYTQFYFAFEGEAIQDGTIEVNDLAPSLLALGDLVDEANKYINHGSASVVLRVRADSEKGSFKIALEVAQHWYSQFVDFFTSPEATALSTFLAIIGISGALGVIQLIKLGKGKKPKTVVEIDQSTRVRVEFEGEEPIEVEHKVLDLFNNVRARDAVSRTVRPLRGKGINELRFFHKGKETVKIAQDEADYFRSPASTEDELVSETETILRIIAVSFKEGNKWRLSDGGNTYFITLLDEEFLNRVHGGEIRFGENDCLRVLLRLRQWYERGELKIAREIIKVIEHIPSGRQSLMQFDSKKEQKDTKNEYP